MGRYIVYLLTGLLGALAYRLTPPRTPWSDWGETVRCLLLGIVVSWIFYIMSPTGSWETLLALLGVSYYPLDWLAWLVEKFKPKTSSW